MPRRQITGFSNPTVKLLRSLRDKKHRRREGRFLAEAIDDETDQLGQRRFRFLAGDGNLDLVPARGAQHHESEDRTAGGIGAILAHGHAGSLRQPRHGVDKLGARPGMQPLGVDDADSLAHLSHGRQVLSEPNWRRK